MPDDSFPGPTPTGYQRTQGGGLRWQPPTAERLGGLLPQYNIECILGHGGMGAVYKGRQKSLDRAVAVKILPPGLEDEDASYVERFKNEARVMARFTHPAIVAVYDFGETIEGQLFIVMEFVDGTDVQKMIEQQGRLPPEHALAVTAHVCDALKYAHEHGVIHRDIKPANVLINREGAVKVADFGLAKADEAGASGLTKSGMAMGTPDFVAPETLVMGMNVDGRADLYAVGVMLYNMLTGKVPRGAFKPASVMVPGTDPRFDKIVQRAMQMDREERYQTAVEIRRDLDVILTTPLMQAGGKSSAAIPKQSLPARNASPGDAGGPQKPVARGPQKPMGKSANVPVDGRRVRQNAEAAPENTPDRTLASAPTAKSKAPLFLGIGAAAAIAVGAFVMVGGKKEAGRAAGPPAAAGGSSSPTSPNAALAGASAPPSSAPPSSTPIKVREEPKPAAAPISNPKSTISNTAATTKSKPADQPLALPAPATGMSPLPAAAPASAPAAISNLKSPISNAAPAAFPPGQWVKMFTKFEDLPESLRKQGVKFEDGWIRFGGAKRFVNLSSELRGNYGVRLTYLRQSEANDATTGPASISVRLQRNELNGYNANVRDEQYICNLRESGKDTKILGKPCLNSPRIGGEGSMEVSVVGDKLIGRVGNSFVATVINDRWKEGSAKVSGSEDIRDIEVINLDGIPEAEALRILGVDEKGNDLRAIAAKQEQQKAEQAKQTDAIAAIPELKTLHEQFVKLQAERVTAPFEADVAKLNTSYIGGIDREIAKEKKAGHLDGVIALEAEKKLIQIGVGTAH